MAEYLRTGHFRSVPFSQVVMPLIPNGMEPVFMSLEELLTYVPFTKEQVLYQMLYPRLKIENKVTNNFVVQTTGGMFTTWEDFTARKQAWEKSKDTSVDMVKQLKRVADASEAVARRFGMDDPASRSQSTGHVAMGGAGGEDAAMEPVAHKVKLVYLHYRSWLERKMLGVESLITEWFNSELLWPGSTTLTKVEPSSAWWNQKVFDLKASAPLGVKLPSVGAFAHEATDLYTKFSHVFDMFTSKKLSYRSLSNFVKTHNLGNPAKPSKSAVWIYVMIKYVTEEANLLEQLGNEELEVTGMLNTYQDMLLPQGHYLRSQGGTLFELMSRLLRHKYFPSIVSVEQLALPPWVYDKFLSNAANLRNLPQSTRVEGFPTAAQLSNPLQWVAFYAATELREILLENYLQTNYNKFLEGSTIAEAPSIYTGQRANWWLAGRLQRHPLKQTLQTIFAMALQDTTRDTTVTAAKAYATKVLNLASSTPITATPARGVSKECKHLLDVMYEWTMCPHYKYKLYSHARKQQNMQDALVPLYNGRGLLTRTVTAEAALNRRKDNARKQAIMSPTPLSPAKS